MQIRKVNASYYGRAGLKYSNYELLKSITSSCIKYPSDDCAIHMKFQPIELQLIYKYIYTYIYIFLYYPTPSQLMMGKILFKDFQTSISMKFKIQLRAQCKIMIN